MIRSIRAAILVAASLGSAVVWAGEIRPAEIERSASGVERGVYSERTLSVGVMVDRHEARVLSYALKARPFVAALGTASPRPYVGDSRRELQVEVALRGSGGRTYTRRLDVGPLCLDHEPEAEPHIEGDTIRPHRDAFLVELPELAGFDRVEVAYHQRYRGALTRRTLGVDRLDRGRFNRAAGPFGYADLAFADAGDPPAGPRASTVTWPEQIPDPDLYRIYGDPVEGDRRLNVVIVPDGYTYAQKSTMEQHAQDLVDYLRQEAPYEAHDRFINYTLVYAYSQQSGTDQCDCGTVVDTAMGTRFPQGNGICGSSANRCLSYGAGCDDSGTTNIVAAEQRAPYHDETIVMVNTTRYGGCAGSRSTYSAAHSSGEAVGAHELGHSVAGLADEYTSNSGCGPAGHTHNTSSDPINGNWPEWIADLGAPREGARYWTECIYRPEQSCKMRSIGADFCAVCNQRWSLMIFGHPRVQPTAPVETVSAAPSQVVIDSQIDFSITTRLSQGAGATHDITWSVESPGGGTVVVAADTVDYTHLFDQLGTYTVSCEVIADTNFVKPEKYGSNRRVVEWEIEVVPTICEVGCADGIPQCDVDRDGLGDICDPCAASALNDCYGPVARDLTVSVDLRINTDSTSTDTCSGSLVDCRGRSWVADFGAPASSSGYNQAGDPFTCNLAGGCPLDASGVFGCSDTATEQLFRCEHRDPPGTPELLYHFDVPDGEYLVNLLFMNADAGTAGPGDRVFSVAINGAIPVQLQDFDPVAAAIAACPPSGSGCEALSRSTLVEVSGAAGLDIEFLSNVGQPTIKGIEVLCLESTWYRDADGDGYGDPAVTTVACYQPAGFVPDASDCDDTSDARYPGAPEVCDSLDNDCDGPVDEDGDGDGYGVCDDCLEDNPYQWALPDEVTNLRWTAPETLVWDEPDVGGFYPIYGVLRTDVASDFDSALCSGGIWFVTQHGDPEVPAAAAVNYYLVRAENFCGPGTLGYRTGPIERTGPACGLDGSGGN